MNRALPMPVPRVSRMTVPDRPAAGAVGELRHARGVGVVDDEHRATDRRADVAPSAGQPTQPGSMLAALVEPAVLDDARQAAADGQVVGHVAGPRAPCPPPMRWSRDRLRGRGLRRLLADPRR